MYPKEKVTTVIAYYLGSSMYEGYLVSGLPEGIEPAAWAVLVSYLTNNGLAGEVAQYTFEPRELVRKYLHLFSLGRHSIACGDWAAKL